MANRLIQALLRSATPGDEEVSDTAGTLTVGELASVIAEYPATSSIARVAQKELDRRPQVDDTKLTEDVSGDVLGESLRKQIEETDTGIFDVPINSMADLENATRRFPDGTFQGTVTTEDGETQTMFGVNAIAIEKVLTSKGGDITKIEGVYTATPRTLRPNRVRSKLQGRGFLEYPAFRETDGDLFYCPGPNRCFAKAVAGFGLVDKNDNPIPKKVLDSELVSTAIAAKYVSYKHARKEYFTKQYGKKDSPVSLVLITPERKVYQSGSGETNLHWIRIKQACTLKQLEQELALLEIETAIDNIETKTFPPARKQGQKYDYKPPTVVTYVYDLETYSDEKYKAHPYAAGFALVLPKQIPKNEGCVRPKIKIGEDCCEQMLNHIITQIGQRKTRTVVYMYAHNGGKFDHVILLEKALKIISVKTRGKIVKTGRGIVDLQLQHEKIKFIFRDTLHHFMGSLKSLTKSFDLPVAKMDYDIAKITKDNYMDLTEEWVPYLKMDVSCLAYLLSHFNQAYKALGAVADVNTNREPIHQFLTSSSFTKWYLSKKRYQIPAPVNKEAVDFMREAVYGGRVISNNSEFEGSEDDYMIALDANSLYPAAMVKYVYPSGEPTVKPTDKTVGNIARYLWIKPPTNCPLPIAPRRTGVGLEYSATATIYNQVFNHVDIDEFRRFGYEIGPSTDIVYLNSGDADEGLKEIVEDLFHQRRVAKGQIRQDGTPITDEAERIRNTNTPLERAIKLILNTIYGKMVEKPFSKQYLTRDPGIIEKGDQVIYLGQDAEDKVVYYKVEAKKQKNIVPYHIGGLILANSRRIMNNAIVVTGIDKGENTLYYTDTDSLYVNKECMDRAQEAGLIGEDLGQFKNDYGTGAYIRYFLSPGKKMKYLEIERDGVLEKEVTWKGNTNRNTDGVKELFKQMIAGETVEVVNETWRRHLVKGVTVAAPTVKRFKLSATGRANNLNTLPRA